MIRKLFDRRSWRFWWQRRTKGWDDSETWNLNYEIAKFTLPRLQRFKELLGSYPGGMTFEEWKEIVDKMIVAMEFMVADYDGEVQPYNKEKSDEVQKGLKLFGKYFGNLWQ